MGVDVTLSMHVWGFVLVVTSAQPGFLGGRLAIRRALAGTEAASVPPLAILHNQEGAPVLPEGLAASISHKRHMAVALVQPGCEGNIGMVVPFFRPLIKYHIISVGCLLA